MNKKVIKLTESDLHRIVKESVNRMLKEVSLKGKSGEEYSLHGDNFDSWATLAKLRKHQLNTPDRIMTGREKDAYKRDDDNSMNSMIDYVLANNMRGKRANRLVDIVDKTSDNISKDIIDNYDPKVESKQRNGDKHTARLSESDLHRIIKESVKRILKESNDEFTYSDSDDLGNGRHRQTIIYNGKEIGYLVTIEKNWLAPLEERYVLPDVEYGLQADEGGHMLDGKKGWIEFKVFKDYDEAFAYASQNFEELAYLFEYGDYD